MANTYFATKFDSAEQELVYMLSDWLSGYGIESGGNVESPSGYFQLADIPADFEIDAEQIEFVEYYEIDTDTIPGHYVCTTDERGFVFVDHFDSLELATNYYNNAEHAYLEWAGDDDL
jgi:hypothetical protein